MFRSTAWISLLFLSLVGCRSAGIEAEAPEPMAPTEPVTATLVPAGTSLQVRLNQRLGTEVSNVGDRFTAEVIEPVVTQNGATVIPAGAMVRGEVTGLQRSERAGEQALIQVAFQTIEIDGRSHPLEAQVTDTDVEVDREGSDIGKGAGIGAAAGFVLGAIVGRGVKEGLIGGALGAGAGTVISLGVGDVDANLPEGSGMTLQLTRPLDLSRPGEV